MSARRSIVVVAIAALLTAGCAGGASRSPDAPVEPRVCQVASPMPGQRSVDDCLKVVQALNKALSGALARMVPPNAAISNNNMGEDGKGYGGPGISFMRQGVDHFFASVRIRDGSTPYNVDVDLGPYDSVPTTFPCEVAIHPAAASEAKLKGLETVECGHSASDGRTVFRSLDTAPYGSGEFAKFLVPHAYVAVYRPGGELIEVRFQSVLETGPKSPPGMVPMNLTMNQLLAIADTPGLTRG